MLWPRSNTATKRCKLLKANKFHRYYFYTVSGVTPTEAISAAQANMTDFSAAVLDLTFLSSLFAS